jgi:hypothetical protein
MDVKKEILEIKSGKRKFFSEDVKEYFKNIDKKSDKEYYKQLLVKNKYWNNIIKEED